MARPALCLVALLGACTGVPELPPPLPPSPPPVTTAAPVARPPRAPQVGPGGETVRVEGRRLVIEAANEQHFVEIAELHAAPGERARLGISPTALLYLDDGTLLIGMGDGTIRALDSARKHRFSLGFHGAIRGLVPAGPGLVAVSTERGVLALLGSDGRLRWEREVTGERLGPAAVTPEGTVLAASKRGVFAISRAGEAVFTHASPFIVGDDPAVTLEGSEVVIGAERFPLAGPHPPIADLEPTFPLTFHRVATGNFSALLEDGPDALLALVDYPLSEYNDWPSRATQELVRVTVADEKSVRTALPFRTKDKDVFISRGLPDYATRSAPTRLETAPLVFDALVTGPGGSPWIVGRRLSGELTSGEDGFTGAWIGAGIVFERDGKGVRERRDLHEAFAAHLGRGTQLGRVAAAPIGKAALFCFGHGEPTCALHDGPGFHLIPAPERAVAVSRIGDEDWLVTEEGHLHRRIGDSWQELPLPGPRKLVAVAGSSPRDVWAESSLPPSVLHFDGSAWRDVPVPVPALGGFFVRATNDVWAANGTAHWDGTRWAPVYGVPSTRRVIARGQGEVWLAGTGLWRGIAPGPTPVRLPAPPADPGAITQAAHASIGPAEAAHAVERWSFPVKGEAPLTRAHRVQAASDGIVWMHAADRLVEIDRAGKATTLRRASLDAFSRWVVPEAEGRGLLLDGSAVRRLERGKPSPAEATLDQHELVAIDVNSQGAAWTVGNSEAEQRTPQALVRAGSADPFQPVLGLPAATWADLAVGADGGAWLAGALGPGPSGEGLLWHARGRAGSAGSARFRAQATLLAVTAVGADEAWAVGAGGTILHVQGEAVTRYVLASGEWLRAVHAAGPRDVWIGGDGGTLLHFDGSLFHPVAHPLGTNAAVTGIASAAGAIWAVSPSGILRITRRP